MLCRLDQFGAHQLVFLNIYIVTKQRTYLAVVVVIHTIISMINHAIIFLLHQVICSKCRFSTFLKALDIQDIGEI
jgi:hypothetical protein